MIFMIVPEFLPAAALSSLANEALYLTLGNCFSRYLIIIILYIRREVRCRAKSLSIYHPRSARAWSC